MATKLSTSTLSVSLREDITLNGQNYGSENKLRIPGIKQVVKRIITVPTSEVSLIAMSTAVAAGTFKESEVRYIRITNLDANNHVNLTFKNSRTPSGLTDEFALKLDEGHSFIYPGLTTGGVSASMVAADNATIVTTTGNIEAMGSLTNVIAQASGSACDLELIIASS